MFGRFRAYVRLSQLSNLNTEIRYLPSSLTVTGCLLALGLFQTGWGVSRVMSQAIMEDGHIKVLKIIPSESDLCDIKTNIPCPVLSCSKIFRSSSNLTMHLEKVHKLMGQNRSSLEKKNFQNITYQYYCPIKFCQYHCDLKSTKKKIFFQRLKYLKQHFLKVHSEKRFPCNGCDKSFSLESALKRHQAECGVEYKCSCGQLYLSRHSLLLHASRKEHFVDEKYKRPKVCSAPVMSDSPSPVTILPKIVPQVTCVSVESDGISDYNHHIQTPISSVPGTLLEKPLSFMLKKKTDLSSLVKRKIVLKKIENAHKLAKLKDPVVFDFSMVSKDKKNSSVLSCVLMNENCELSSELESDVSQTNDSSKISDVNFPSDWSKLEVSAEINEPGLVFSHTDINLNELNASGKTNSQTGSIFDNFEFSNSPKLSQSTQTTEPSISSLATTQTDFDISFDDSNLCNYYDSFDFSNSPKLSQSTQTFQSSSQVSQTDIQSSFFDDSSNKSFLSELIGYYDNFETSNSPKLSQSTQTIGHSLCSWSDNVTQTDLDDKLFDNSSLDRIDDCYHSDPSFSSTVCITEPSNKKSILTDDKCYLAFSDTGTAIDSTDETVSTQTNLSISSQDDRRGKSIDDFTTSETQTDSSAGILSGVWVSSKIQSFNSAQTQTSASLNYLIDSETQTQELLNQFIDIQTQTYGSNLF